MTIDNIFFKNWFLTQTLYASLTKSKILDKISRLLFKHPLSQMKHKLIIFIIRVSHGNKISCVC